MALLLRRLESVAPSATLAITHHLRCLVTSPTLAEELHHAQTTTTSSPPLTNNNAANTPLTSFAGVQTIGDLPLPYLIPPQKKPKRAPVSLEEAIRIVKADAQAKFDETIELAVNLGTDPRRGDQMVRGTAMLPHGTGKNVRVCVFATGDAAEEAKSAGAEIIGADDLITDILNNSGSGINFDKCVATPAMMPKLSKIARILGPRGLMPNPKLGTVTDRVSTVIGDLKKGRVEFRADKGAVVHAGVGKVSFLEDQLYANIGALASALLSARPKGIKGAGSGGYLLKASLSSTMGKGVPVVLPSLIQAAQLTAAQKTASSSS